MVRFRGDVGQAFYCMMCDDGGHTNSVLVLVQILVQVQQTVYKYSLGMVGDDGR